MGRRQNFSVVVARRPVSSNIASVSVKMVMSGIGTLPKVARRWMWQFWRTGLQVVRPNSMGQTARHDPSLILRVSAPYSDRRCVNMASG